MVSRECCQRDGAQRFVTNRKCQWRERDMTLRPKISATSRQTNIEKKQPRQDKSPGRTFASRQNRLSHRDSSGSHTPQHQLTTRPVPCTTNLGSPQLVYPWSECGRHCTNDSFLEILDDCGSHHSFRFSSF